MRRFIKAALCVCALLILALAATPKLARAQVACNLDIIKAAFPPVSTVFDFTISEGGDSEQFSLTSGNFESFKISLNEVTVTEELPEGWVLEDIECNFEGGAAFTDIENGVIIKCSDPGSNINCTFINRGPANVPTLSQWGMIAAAAGLMIVGVYFAVRRKKGTASA